MKLEVYMAKVLCVVVELVLFVLLAVSVHRVYRHPFHGIEKRVFCIEVVLCYPDPAAISTNDNDAAVRSSRIVVKAKIQWHPHFCRISGFSIELS